MGSSDSATGAYAYQVIVQIEQVNEQVFILPLIMLRDTRLAIPLGTNTIILLVALYSIPPEEGHVTLLIHE